jgi:hypothetical protein
MAQLDETLMNLEALLAEANRLAPAPLKLALLKIYVPARIRPGAFAHRIVQAYSDADADAVPARRHLPPGTPDRNRRAGDRQRRPGHRS